MESISSPFRGKLIQTHDEPRLNPKTAWVHYRWVQTGTRLRIQAERAPLHKEETLNKSVALFIILISSIDGTVLVCGFSPKHYILPALESAVKIALRHFFQLFVIHFSNFCQRVFFNKIIISWAIHWVKIHLSKIK